MTAQTEVSASRALSRKPHSSFHNLKVLAYLATLLQRTCGLFVFHNATSTHLVDTLALPLVHRLLPEPFKPNFEACLGNPDDPVIGARHYGPFPSQWPGGFQLPLLHLAESPWPTPNVTMDLLTSESVRTQMAALQRKSPIILHVFNNEYVHITKGYVHLIKAWLAHIARLGLLDHVLLVGSTWKNQDECLLLNTYAPCWVHTPSMNLGNRELAADTRWLYTDALLAAGFDVLLSDADAFFLENPFTHFPKDKDALGLSDRLYDGDSDLSYCNDVKGSPCQSTGFNFFRSTNATRSAVHDFLERISHGGGWEQSEWQEFAMRLGDGYAVLPYRGRNTFSNWGIVQTAMLRGEDISVAVLHMGAVSGDTKENTFRCLQLWLDLDAIAARQRQHTTELHETAHMLQQAATG